MDAAQRFKQMKREGRPVAMLTAYDAPTARIQAEAGLDILLVGDSVGTNVLGYRDEREVTLADILHHLSAVRRGAPGAAIVADLPFGTYDDATRALANARALTGAGADFVKFEGPRPDIVTALTGAGIAVCGHLGLEPQHHAEKRLKGKTAEAARDIFDQALALDRAGAALLVLELVPEELAAVITKAVAAPTIGIGAGRGTDGQVLVVTDLLGYRPVPFRHNRRYAEAGLIMAEAFAAYAHDVHARRFPGAENLFLMPKDEREKFTGGLAAEPMSPKI